MGTIIIAGIIFGAVGVVIYQYGVKKKPSCDCSSTDCPVKKQHSTK
ncbi:FeoB-associated Cys-rich membrane protein [Vagococcus vulneris]|nr:FeoB-associated Cys-rich membrane protein [Vagococcus vulneris]